VPASFVSLLGLWLQPHRIAPIARPNNITNDSFLFIVGLTFTKSGQSTRKIY
jgi:hypothetical protein